MHYRVCVKDPSVENRNIAKLNEQLSTDVRLLTMQLNINVQQQKMTATHRMCHGSCWHRQPEPQLSFNHMLLWLTIKIEPRLLGQGAGWTALPY